MEPNPEKPGSIKTNDEPPRGDPNKDVSSRIQETVERDAKNLKPDTPEAHAESMSQPIIQTPSRNNPFSSDSPSTSFSPSAFSADTHINQLPTMTPSDHSKEALKRKVIFETGGITNGKQALEVLEAGASVAKVYTALLYGGVGWIARIKDEMREEMTRRPSRSSFHILMRVSSGSRSSGEINKVAGDVAGDHTAP